MKTPQSTLFLSIRFAIVRALVCLPFAVAVVFSAAGTAQPAMQATGPVAEAAAIVTSAHARFTVLTPELIRLEWAEDRKFEDHASLVFINRDLPVPAFTVKRKGEAVTINTDKLHLVYQPSAHEKGFAPENLSITLQLAGKPVVWHPGAPSTGNLLGTTRTLDGATGPEHLKEPIGQGLISRDGWVVVEDAGPLFDSSGFQVPLSNPMNQPWVMERPSGSRQDLYFFGYGHGYSQALGRTTFELRAAFHCRRALPLGRGGRATGPTATRNCATSSTAFTRTTCPTTSSSSTWTGTRHSDECSTMMPAATERDGAATPGTTPSSPTRRTF